MPFFHFSSKKFGSLAKKQYLCTLFLRKGEVNAAKLQCQILLQR